MPYPLPHLTDAPLPPTTNFVWWDLIHMTESLPTDKVSPKLKWPGHQEVAKTDETMVIHD